MSKNDRFDSVIKKYKKNANIDDFLFEYPKMSKEDRENFLTLATNLETAAQECEKKLTNNSNVDAFFENGKNAVSALLMSDRLLNKAQIDYINSHSPSFQA